jgi:Autophagy protein ATG9
MQFPAPITSAAAGFVAYVAAAVAALVITVALTHDWLMESHAWGHTLVWWLAAAGMVLAVARGLMEDEAPAYDPVHAYFVHAYFVHAYFVHAYFVHAYFVHAYFVLLLFVRMRVTVECLHAWRHVQYAPVRQSACAVATSLVTFMQWTANIARSLAQAV